MLLKIIGSRFIADIGILFEYLLDLGKLLSVPYFIFIKMRIVIKIYLLCCEDECYNEHKAFKKIYDKCPQ